MEGTVLSVLSTGKSSENALVELYQELPMGRKNKFWSEISKYSGNMAPTKPQRYVCGNNDLYKVCCAYYLYFYIYACH